MPSNRGNNAPGEEGKKKKSLGNVNVTEPDFLSGESIRLLLNYIAHPRVIYVLYKGSQGLKLDFNRKRDQYSKKSEITFIQSPFVFPSSTLVPFLRLIRDKNYKFF